VAPQRILPYAAGVGEGDRTKCGGGGHSRIRESSPHERRRNAGRLYVSRRRFSESVPRRVLLNEAEVVEALAALGFEEIFPEELALAARMAAFARAELVVGPSGSGMFNAVFCWPGARVIELEPVPTWRPMHAALYRSMGLDHAFLPGAELQPGLSPAHPNWRLSRRALASLTDFIAALPR
jgi:capsular polysaccharide biosynthesis protein